MSRPKVETVNVVTMKHGEDFAEGWFTGNMDDACENTGIMMWPEWDSDQQASFNDLVDDICGRVFEAVKPQIAEMFVRIANAAIDEERTRVKDPPVPPRVETVETVTREQGLVFAEQMQRETADTEVFGVALSATHVMTFPSDDVDGEETAAQKHFHELTDEIRDRLRDETRELIAEAFVRVVSDVTSRERNR